MRYAPLFLLLFSVGCFLKPAETPPSKKKNYPSDATSTSSIRFRYGVVDDAEKFIGSTYQYAGRDPKTGFDCSGFTSFVLARHNVKVSPASSAQSKEGRPVELDKVLPGDLVFFAQDGKTVSHVAMVVTRGKDGIVCVHSTTSRGVIKENISQSSYWKTKILFARDVIGTKR
jgi:cell wall-associated NlpC family hydrolase